MPTIEIRNLFQLPHLLKIPELVCNKNFEVETIWFPSAIAVHNSLTEIVEYFNLFGCSIDAVQQQMVQSIELVASDELFSVVLVAHK